MSACEGAPIDAELCSEITSPLELFEVTSMFDSEDEEPSAGDEIPSTADPVEADSLSGWDEAGDPEAGDKFPSSVWDIADDDDEEI